MTEFERATCIMGERQTDELHSFLVCIMGERQTDELHSFLVLRYRDRGGHLV
jgi:hypothetical protein